MKLKRPLEPNPVQKLAMQHGAGTLIAAAAARSAAAILADARDIPDAVREAVERFDSLLKAALNSVVEQEC